MQYVVCDKKEIHLMDGPRQAGAVVELDDRTARRYLEQGAVERYETKVIREVPFEAAGAVEPLSASPVVPASTEPTVKPSASGGKKRGRKKASSR